MKIIFFGTPDFAVPILRKLANSNYEIVAVVTRPDKPAGRKQEPLPSPVKVLAKKLKLKVFQPKVLEIGNWKLETPSADLFIVASYGKIIPKEILDLPKFGALNTHPSLLPKYRGPSPIQSTILNGDTETGVTIIKLDAELDHGEIVASEKLQMRSDRVTYGQLHDELAEIGAKLLVEVLPKYIKGEINLATQDHSKTTFTKIITKEDARINWQKSAEEIDRLVRAYEAWPIAWTTLEGKRLKIYDAKPVNEKSGLHQPGQIISAAKSLILKCGAGALQINELQLESKKKLKAAEFINGHHGLQDKILI